MIVFGKGFSQITGSLFMLPDNFYAQMYNPSYMRTDNAIEVSIAGFGGLSFINQGSFKISDLITTAGGSPVIDFDNFYNHVDRNNFIRQDFSIPIAFFSMPLKKGVFSFYYKENLSSALNFKDDVVDFLVNGNLTPAYQNFSSDDMNAVSVGYREFAFGYAKNLNDQFDVGFRAKLLFGAAYFNADNWIFGVETAPQGEVVTLSSGGGGRLMLPVPVILNSDNTINSTESDKALRKYFGAYKNPGFAFDAGFTYYLDEKSTISLSVRDLGGIWSRLNSMNLKLDDKYGFEGFDLISAVRYPEESGYKDPQFLVRMEKDSVSAVYKPIAEFNKFIFTIPPKTVLHYQYKYSNKHSFGFTNQSAFQKNNFQNILTFTAMQSWANLSVFENVNLHGVSDISVGGGIQYEGNFVQAFLATDNVIAFYHPAANKTFSITAGICLLLNHKKNAKWGNMKGRKGKISPDLPYYKQLKRLPD